MRPAGWRTCPQKYPPHRQIHFTRQPMATKNTGRRIPFLCFLRILYFALGGLQLLFNLGGFAYAATQIVELGTAHLAAADELHAGNGRGVNRENLLHTNAV